MPNRLCWKCEKHAHMTPYGSPYVITASTEAFTGRPLAGFYTCDNCKFPSAAIAGLSDEPMAPGHYGASDRITAVHQSTPDNKFEWIPGSAEGKDFPDVPEHIAAAANEAHRCRSFGALRASTLLARSVIEASCKEKGIVKGQLHTKIDAMETAGHIRKHTQKAAHEIRYMGNDMAHGDFVEKPTSDDADEVLNLMDEFLNEVYQGPARVARTEARRVAKTNGPSHPPV